MRIIINHIDTVKGEGDQEIKGHEALKNKHITISKFINN